MNNRTIIAAFAFAALLTGCSNTGNRSGMADSRLLYEDRTAVVEVQRLEKSTFIRQLSANGKLSARAKSTLSFRSAGTVSDIAVSEGERITAGTVIAVQDDRDKKLVFEAALIALDKAGLEYLDIIAGQGYGTDDTLSVPADVKRMARMRSGYDEARNRMLQAKLDLDGSVIKAPFDGVVADIGLREYDNSGSEPVCMLIDDRFFNVDFKVLESEYPFIGKGLKVEVIPFSGSSEPLYGEIVSINPKVDENGQIGVTASVRNDGSCIDGMNVRIMVERDFGDMLVVPKSAVVIRDNMDVLFKYSGGKARWTYVNVLMSNSSEHAVTANTDRGSELEEGDTVIVSGNLNLADGSEVILK